MALMIATIWTGSASAQSTPSSFTFSILGFCISFPSAPACLGFTALNNSLYAQEGINAAIDQHRSGVASIQQSRRDAIQAIVKGRGNLKWDASGSRWVPAFAADPEARTEYGPFSALAYSKTGMVTKAPPRAPVVTNEWIVSGWVQGSADYEDRDLRFGAANVSTKTRSYTGIGGVDFVKIGIATGTDAIVIGFLGMGTDTRTETFVGDVTKSTTPGGGLYVSYIAGGFSVDYSFLANFTDSNVQFAGTAATVQIGTTDSYVTSANIQYKWDVPSSQWWIEPTGGYSYTRTYSPVAFTTIGHTLRFQGGVRAGTEWAWGTAKVQPTIMGLAYEDVSIKTPTIPPAIFIGLNDQGYVWGKGVGKLNVQWTDKFSTYVEGEIRGRADVMGYAGRLAARLTF